jgi:hypothetical protein
MMLHRGPVRPMFSRPLDRGIVFRDHPANLIPWVRQEYFRVPELDGRTSSSLDGMDVRPFLSRSDVRYHEALPTWLHPRYRLCR